MTGATRFLRSWRRWLPTVGVLALVGAVVWVTVFHFQLRDAVRAFVRLQEGRLASGATPIPVEAYMRPARAGAARVASVWAGAVIAAGGILVALRAQTTRRRER